MPPAHSAQLDGTLARVPGAPRIPSPEGGLQCQAEKNWLREEGKGSGAPVLQGGDQVGGT